MYSERAAGTNGRHSGSTKDCLKYEERPSTPPEIAKYRRSNALNSGVKFQSDGASSDNMTRRNQDLTYGVATDRGNNTAASLIGHQATSELDMMKLYKAEKVYRSQAREPLGRTMDRGNVLPTKFTRGKL